MYMVLKELGLADEEEIPEEVAALGISDEAARVLVKIKREVEDHYRDQVKELGVLRKQMEKLTTRLSTHPDPEYLQLIAMWGGKQFGIIRAVPDEFSPIETWETCLIPSITIVRARTLFDLMERTTLFMEAWDKKHEGGDGPWPPQMPELLELS